MNRKIMNRKFKKTMRGFIKDEDGFVDKDKILKIGLGTVAAVGILGSLSKAYAGNVTLSACSLVTHTDVLTHFNNLGCTASGTCYKCVIVDNASGTHFDHSSRNLSGSGTGWLSGKGSATFSYDGSGCNETFNGTGVFG